LFEEVVFRARLIAFLDGATNAASLMIFSSVITFSDCAVDAG